MEENEQAIIDWVNTFETIKSCEKLSDLTDGTVIADILYEMCPKHFEKDSINRNVNENWALAAANIRKILRMIDEYYVNVLKKRIDTKNIDINQIVKVNDPDEILYLVELVVGVAVMCEDKAIYIRNIFHLNDLSQAFLKGLIEQVLHLAEDLPDNTTTNSTNTINTSYSDPILLEETSKLDNILLDNITISSININSEEHTRLTEMMKHLRLERDNMLEEVTQLEKSNESLQEQLKKANEKFQLKDQQLEVIEGTERSRLQMLEAQNSKLQQDIEDSKRDFDLKIVENESLKYELKSFLQKLEMMKELQAKLEMEAHQQADELELNKEKVNKLVKTELMLEKYQKKLEEMNDVKKQNKELSEQMDKYLDQISELESSNKSITTLNKLIEQYKNKAIELETEKFQLVSSLQSRDEHIKQLNSDLDKLKDSKRLVMDECVQYKMQLEQYEVINDSRSNNNLDNDKNISLEDSYIVETVPMLKEKVKKLERELKLLIITQNQQDVLNSNNKIHDTTTDTNTTNDNNEGIVVTIHEVKLLQQELEDVRKIKKDREDSLLLCKKQLSELQYAFNKYKESSIESDNNNIQSIQLKEMTQKLSETSNTVRLLQDKLKEKETMINKVEQEKSKLETYTKRSLTTFKEKYMGVLHTLKEEKEELSQKLKMQLEKTEKNYETWQREERLISSAMFELGTRIMDQQINSQLSGNSYHTNNNNVYDNTNNQSKSNNHNKSNMTFLDVQKDALERSITDSVLQSPYHNNTNNNNNNNNTNGTTGQLSSPNPLMTGKKLFTPN